MVYYFPSHQTKLFHIQTLYVTYDLQPADLQVTTKVNTADHCPHFANAIHYLIVVQ